MRVATSLGLRPVHVVVLPVRPTTTPVVVLGRKSSETVLSRRSRGRVSMGQRTSGLSGVRNTLHTLLDREDLYLYKSNVEY